MALHDRVNVEIAKAGFRAWSLLILWSVPVVLFAAAAFELALALGLVEVFRARAEQDVEGEEQSPRLHTSPCSWVRSSHSPRALPARPVGGRPVCSGRRGVHDHALLHLRSVLPAVAERYSENWSAWAWGWVLGLLAAALVVGVRTYRAPRAGSIATACILPLLWITSLFVSTGH